MPPVNYATLYLQALQQKFTAGLFFNELYNTPNNQRIKWLSAKTIQIPRIDVSGMTDHDREAVGSFSRKVDNSWETKTLGHDREFRTLVDPVDVDESNMALTIANITSVFNDEQKIPEMDKYMASKLYAEFTGYGQTAVTTALDDAVILDAYDTMMEEMDEAEVPAEGRILYVTPAVNTMLKNAQKLQRYIRVDSNAGSVARGVRSLDDVTIKVVSSARMKTLYNFTVGAVADATGFQINMILIHPSAIIAPQKYEFVDLDQPTAATGGKYLYFERKYWDVFVIERKAPGIKIHRNAVAG